MGPIAVPVRDIGSTESMSKWRCVNAPPDGRHGCTVISLGLLFCCNINNIGNG